MTYLGENELLPVLDTLMCVDERELKKNRKQTCFSWNPSSFISVPIVTKQTILKHGISQH